MLRTDTGNFNRFISSVGLLLLIAAVLVPYFYFQDTGVLRISREELGELTPRARDALETRQRRTADLEVPVLILSAALAVGGLAALWFGGRRLRTAQDKEDEALERKAKRDEVEFQRLSDPEIEEKREAEAKESTPEGVKEATAPEPPRAGTVQPPSPTRDLAQRRVTIDRVEDAVRRSFEAEQLDGFEFRSEVKVTGRTSSGHSRQLRLDGIFRAQSRRRADVVLELKIARRSRNLAPIVRQFTDQLIALVARYRDIAGRDATGWLVVVVPDDAEDFDLADRRQLEDRLRSSLANQGVASIVHERDIKDLPWRFRELFDARS